LTARIFERGTYVRHCFALLHWYQPPAAAIMSADWHDNSPIYRQLKTRVIEMMLDGVLMPGDPLPSVRQIAAEFQLNPITVSRAYQELADEQLVEKRRGIGMYMTEGAREKLLDSERKRFLHDEWPAIVERMTRLGLNTSDLLAAAKVDGAANMGGRK
jgi:GntR family transcriptional regulator